MASFRLASCASVLLLAGIGHAAAATGELAACAAIASDAERLACYDGLVRRDRERALQTPAAPPVSAPDLSASPPSVLEEFVTPTVKGTPEGRAYSRLADQWELGQEWSHGVFRLRPHNRTYLLAAYSSSPNETPFQPFRAIVQNEGSLSPAELAFQLSFKLKIADNPLNLPADLWFGYTQRSFWQAFNSRQSSPFRATDYRPEVMAVFPTDLQLLGIHMRFINLGFVHESNGQGASLSRSWNRVYGQVGFERDDLSMLVRRWIRIKEDADEDDNPDITDYLGKGDVVATYRWGGHELSLLGRYNFNTGRGGAQLGWAFPLSEKIRRLKGYVQVFSGYGYSLIDYNHPQTVLGIGITLTE